MNDHEQLLSADERALLEAAVANANGTLAVRSNDLHRLLDEIARLRGERERLMRDAHTDDEGMCAETDAALARAEAERDALREALRRVVTWYDEKHARSVRMMKDSTLEAAYLDGFLAAVVSLSFHGGIEEARALLSSSPASEPPITREDVDGLNAAIAELDEPPAPEAEKK